jgi:peptide deformylase
MKYGHPILRQKGARIETITPEIRKLINNMIETMHAAAGVGLAAQQVGKALQLTTIDVREVKDRPSTIEVNGKPADVADYMPLVLLNPVITPVGTQIEGPEGCLSFPETYAEVPRPEAVEVTAMNPKGETITFKAGGLLSRAIQHEVDHLNGILFIDRMSRKTKMEIRDDLDYIQQTTKAEMQAGKEKVKA